MSTRANSADRGTSVAFRLLQWPTDADELRDAWDSVAAGDDPSYYQAYAWFACYAAIMEDDPSATRCYVAYRAGIAVAIFPLRMARRRIGGVRVRVLELPHGLHSFICEFTFAISEDSAALTAGLVAHLQRSADCRWDALVFPNLLETSETALAIGRASLLPIATIEESGCDYVVCAEFKQSSKHKQKRRRLERSGLVTFDHTTNRSRFTAAFDDFLRVEASGWKGRNGTAVQSDARTATFYRAVGEAFADGDAVRVSTLRVEGRCIAASFALRGGRCLYLLKVGFDEEFAKLSPSFLLFDDLVRDCIAKGDVDVINLITDIEWHQILRPRHLARRTVIVFGRSLRARASRSSLATRRISRPLRSVLRQLGSRFRRAGAKKHQPTA